MDRIDTSPLGYPAEQVNTQRQGWTLGAHRARLAAMSTMIAGPRPPAHKAGQVIAGKYTLLRKMGDGGMGEVWLSRHMALDADVAIKLTRPELIGTDACERLLYEARILGRLDHPSIVRVLDSGRAETGFPFMAMELLAGPSLRQTLVSRRRLSAKAAVRILLPVASALARAHAHGIIHRDLKPDNVILVPESSGALRPKVFDFGIAMCPSSSEEAFSEDGLLGSPEYMSPEQALGSAPVDARSDVWAFCVLFHELLTGRSPFARRSLAETMKAVACEPPPPLPAEHGGVALSALLARGLAKDPERRWASMQELGVALATWALHEGVDEDAAGTAIRSHWLCPVLHPLSDRCPPPQSSKAAATFSLVVPATSTEAPPRAPPRAPLPRRGKARRVALAAIAAGLLTAAGATAMVRGAAKASPAPVAHDQQQQGR